MNGGIGFMFRLVQIYNGECRHCAPQFDTFEDAERYKEHLERYDADSRATGEDTNFYEYAIIDG